MTSLGRTRPPIPLLNPNDKPNSRLRSPESSAGSVPDSPHMPQLIRDSKYSNTQVPTTSTGGGVIMSEYNPAIYSNKENEKSRD